MEVFTCPAFSNLSHERFGNQDGVFSDSFLSSGSLEEPQWVPETPPESLGNDFSPLTDDGGFHSAVEMANPSGHMSLPKTSPVPLPQFEIGDEFNVEARGRELQQNAFMHFVRKSSCFQLAVSFAANSYPEDSLFIRITPTWDDQRSDSSTVIYCCSKHTEHVPDQLEQLSMLRVSGIRCWYELDQDTLRLSVVVPIDRKVQGVPLLIPIESKCFSTCGSNLKKPYHVLVVTLERVGANGRTIVGRRMLNIKFSSTPYRDVRNYAHRMVRTPIRKPFSPSGKRASELDSSQVVMIPVQKKHIETVQLFLKALERSHDNGKPTTTPHYKVPDNPKHEQENAYSTNQEDWENSLYEWLVCADNNAYFPGSAENPLEIH